MDNQDSQSENEAVEKAVKSLLDKKEKEERGRTKYFLPLGVFIGNWLLIPSFPYIEKTYIEGFFIGLVAAVLVLIFSYFYHRLSKS